MKKKSIVLMASLLACTSISAQNNGAITPQVLNQLEASTKTTSSQDKAIRNALGVATVNNLAQNSANNAEKNTYFSNSVNSKGITNQQSSGRCWLFTGLNTLRSKVIAKHNLNKFEFSQVYLFFYDQLEKSNLFLQGIIDTRQEAIDDKMVQWLLQNPLSDGGQFTGIADLTEKYGLVPNSVMPETKISNATSQFDAIMKRKLREFAMQLRESAEKGAKPAALENMKVEQLKTVYRMLTLAYGEPVKEFTWAPKNSQGKYIYTPKKYTPKQFYDEFVGESLYANNIMLMNDPSRPLNKVYEIDYDRHTYDGHNWVYVNLPIEEIKEMAIASIKDSTMMYFSCDVGKELNRETGMLDLNNFDYASLFGTSFNMTKKQRIQSFDSGSTHAMTLKAVDLDENGKPIKWEVENSWGASSGYNGFLIMTDEWFNEYMFRLVVNKKYATPKVLELLKQKPTRLPAWDPMFAGEE